MLLKNFTVIFLCHKIIHIEFKATVTRSPSLLCCQLSAIVKECNYSPSFFLVEMLKKGSTSLLKHHFPFQKAKRPFSNFYHSEKTLRSIILNSKKKKKKTAKSSLLLCPVVNIGMIGNFEKMLYNLGWFKKLSNVYLYSNIEALIDDG